MNKNIKISWEDFFEAQRSLVKKIRATKKQYKYIVAIPSGGLMPAYCLSKSLNLPVVTINIKSYIGENNRGDIKHYKVDGFGDIIKNQEEALIVDDMFDSGNTIKYLQKLYPETDVAVTFARYENNSATFVGEILGHDKWLDFP